MRGCLFTLALAAVVAAVVVVVGLPQVAAGMLTSAVTAAGLQADDTTVTVSSDPPTDLVGLHADRVRIRATDATYRGLAIGALDLELSGVALLDRTVDAVEGRLTGVTVPNVGGRPLSLAEVTVRGGGDATTATTSVPGATVERLIADGIETEAGIRPRSVRLSAPNGVRIDLGTTVDGTLDVDADGNLVMRVPAGPFGIGTIVLLRGGEDLPIRLRGLVVTEARDLRLSGDLSISLLG